MRRVTIAAMAVGMFFVGAPIASAHIHPIVESIDCAQANGLDNRPQGGDVADPPGAVVSGFRWEAANENAFFGHKLNEQCGKVGQG